MTDPFWEETFKSPGGFTHKFIWVPTAQVLAEVHRGKSDDQDEPSLIIQCQSIDGIKGGEGLCIASTVLRCAHTNELLVLGLLRFMRCT